MIKNLIAARILAAATMAQVPPGQSEASAKEQVRSAIPDFRVTAESLRQAQQHSPKILDTADYERARRDLLRHRPLPGAAYCYTVHSYKFSQGDDPTLEGESTCMTTVANAFKRTQAK